MLSTAVASAQHLTTITRSTWQNFAAGTAFARLLGKDIISVSKLSPRERWLAFVPKCSIRCRYCSRCCLSCFCKKEAAWFSVLLLPSVARHGNDVPAATRLCTRPRKHSLCSTKAVLLNLFPEAFAQYCWCTKWPSFNQLLAGLSPQVLTWRVPVNGWLVAPLAFL